MPNPINPVKVLLIDGDIDKTGQVVKVVQLKKDYMNVHQGIWQICVKDICIVIPPSEAKVKDSSTNPNFFQVSCSQVLGEYKTDSVSRLSIPLGTFSHTDNTQELIQFVPLVWFNLNAASNTLRVQVEKICFYEHCEPTKPFKFQLTILLQRVD